MGADLECLQFKIFITIMESATFPWLEFADNAVIPKKLIGKGIPFADSASVA